MSRAPGPVALAVLAVAVCAGGVRAQDTAQVAARADTDTVVVRTLPVNGLLVRPQLLTYEMRVITPDSVHLVGTREVHVLGSTYAGFPAWLLIETRTGRVPSVDSLYLSAVELRPLHWSSTIGQARLALEFSADSVYGGTSGPSGNQTIILPHGHDLLAGSGMTELALELMPHAVGRVDSVSVMEVDLGTTRVLPATVSVDGEQDVDTPTGRVHCWVVSLTTADQSARYWVSEVNPAVVRMQQAVPGRPGLMYEEMLVSHM